MSRHFSTRVSWIPHWCGHRKGWWKVSPQKAGAYTPSWLGVWLVMAGAYLQSVGRECYHQCDQTKREQFHLKCRHD